MAQLLFNWLNNEAKLSQAITSFEEDFKDGYLLGELLFNFNQQDNFMMFDRLFTPDSRIKNFCLLEPTLRRLGVPFNFALAFDIMKGKQGVTKALIAELRAILERVQKNSMPPIAPPGQRGQIMRVMRPGNERFDKSMSAAFEKSVRTFMDNPTDVILHKHVTAKFEEIGRTNDATAAAGDDKDSWEEENEKLRKREVFEHRKKHEAEFKKSWDLMNVDQWKRNQQVGRTRKLKEATAVKDFETRKQVHFQTINDNARAETYNSINAFDQRLEKEVFREDPSLAEGLGASLKKTVTATDGSGLPTLEYTDQTFLDAGLNLALKSMKEHHAHELQRQVVHDRRRRKFVRQQESAHAGALHTRAQAEIVEQLLNQSKCEHIEAEAQKRVLAQREIISENRALRRRGVEAVEAATLDALNAQSGEICARETQWTIPAQRESLESRVALLDQAKASATRFRSNAVAEETVVRILDLVDWVVTARQLGVFHEHVPPKKPKADETPEEAAARTAAEKTAATAAAAANPLLIDDSVVPSPFWADAKAMFISALPMAEASMKPTETNVYSDPPYSLCERPLCVDLSWLLSAPFQAHSQMAPVGTLERAVADLVSAMAADSAAAAAAAAIVTALPSGEEVPTERLVSEHLSSKDAAAHISCVATADIAGYDVAPSGAALPVENTARDESAAGFKKNLVVTPNWLYTTPPKHLLGEILIATSTAANPIAEDPPAPINVPALPLRAALCGVSDISRQSVTTALKSKIPDLAVISTEALVHQAVRIAGDIRSQQAADSSLIESEAPRLDTTPEQSLALEVTIALESGLPVSDELYVALVVGAIQASLPPVKPELSDREKRDKALADAMKTEKALAEEKAAELEAAAQQALRYPGFLLVDFPSTKEQSILLFQALSGINYGEDKPKAGDRASQFASAKPETYDRLVFDPLKCGLNKVIYVDQSNTLSLTDERARSRVDLNTGEVVLVDQFSSSIDTLQELYTPLRPVQTISIEHSQTAAEKESLLKFLQDLKILSVYSVGDWDGDFKTREEAVAAVLQDVANATKLFPIRNDANGEGGGGIAEGDAPVVDSSSLAAPSLKHPPSTQVPSSIAKVLIGMWGDAEKQSVFSTKTYFSAMRDVRYQMVQRRRAIHDVIRRYLIKRDSRQHAFEEFKDKYNMFEDDFRFDFTFIAEMLLQSLELGRSLWAMSDHKRDKVLDILKSTSKDGVTTLLVHRCQVEGAALMQAEQKRFLTAMHILFDFTKISAAFDSGVILRNSVEECLAVVVPSVGESTEPPAGGGAKDKGKPADKGKKGEPAAAVAWRNVVPPVILPIAAMNTIPGPEEEAPPVDPKAKGKPPAKGKGAVEEVPANPLDLMAAAVLGQLNSWSKETFAVQRVLFPDQEALCAVIENAVWFEAERCKFSIERIKAAVQKQAAWIKEEEERILRVMDRMAYSRHQREYQVTHRLLHMIGESTAKAEQIKNIWVIDGDTLSVFANKICAKVDSPPIMPNIVDYPGNKLNDSQLEALANWIHATKTGTVILEEDVRSILIQACSNGGEGLLINSNVVLGSKRICRSGSALLNVTLHKCNGLFNADITSESDPYCMLRVQERVVQSRKIENDLNPVFEEKFTVPWNGDSHIEFHVYDHDIHTEHDHLGVADIDLHPHNSRLEAGEVVTIDAHPLLREGKPEGTVTISVSLVAPTREFVKAAPFSNATLPKSWRTPEVYEKLIAALLPASRIAGLDESVGYVDANHLLDVLRDFDSSKL